jgi:hypothetical protein
MTDFSDQNVDFEVHDDSLYLLNLATSGLLMSRLTPAD